MPVARPVRALAPVPLTDRALADRLRQTLVGAGTYLLFVPAVALFVLTLVMIPLGLVLVGFGLANLVVPATERLAGLHRRLAGKLLDDEIPTGYAPPGPGFLGRPVGWLRDPARWRDVGFLAFSMTGGAVLSALPAVLLVTPVAHLILFLAAPSWTSAVLLGIGAACVPAWWAATPALVRARAAVDRGILGSSRLEQLERRVSEVTESRTEALDSSAAEVRRIERDLHDGAQARIAAVGMNVGLAEKLLATDPTAAAALLREARESTVAALADLRSVVRGIHPPVLADRGLAGALSALAVPIPLPVTLSLDLPDRLPAPVESAVYFAVAELLANTVKHSGAARAWVSGRHDGGRLRLVVGDDGVGGADPAGSGLAGVARRLAAFDGTMAVSSPAGGPTVVSLEVPCPTGR